MSRPVKNPTTIGSVYRRLTVLAKDGLSNRGNVLYRCRCTCGAEVTVAGVYLRDGTTGSCGCLKREKIHIGRPQIDLEEVFLTQIMGAYRRRAIRHQRVFELTRSQFRDLVFSKCDICGIYPCRQWKPTHRKTSGGMVLWNGIDRIDCALGYVVNNVRTCCTDCNMIRGNLPEEHWQRWLRRIRTP